MDLNDISLCVASFIAGVWNMLNERFVSWRRTLCVFILGFSFCYTPAMIMSHYGYDSEISTCVGYLCGVLSTKIYDALVRCLNKVPDIFEQKIGGKANDKRE